MTRKEKRAIKALRRQKCAAAMEARLLHKHLMFSPNNSPPVSLDARNYTLAPRTDLLIAIRNDQDTYKPPLRHFESGPYKPGADTILCITTEPGYGIRTIWMTCTGKISEDNWEYKRNVGSTNYRAIINRGGYGVLYRMHSGTMHRAEFSSPCEARTVPLWTALAVGARIKATNADNLGDNHRLMHAAMDSNATSTKFKDLETRYANKYGIPHPASGQGIFITLNTYVDEHVRRKINDREFFQVPNQFPAPKHTGAHLSTIDDRLVAYYPTDRHKRELMAQRIKPGKYLKKYFPNMTDDEIRIRASIISAGATLKFFSKGEDMVKYYMALAKSEVVSSCMSKDKWRIHPLMVYDDSDVELAVLFLGEEPIARALYNKYNKNYPMVYGQWERMKAALDKEGFIHGDLIGSKLKRIEIAKGRILLPYIDANRPLTRTVTRCAYVTIHDDHIEVTAAGIAASRYEEGWVPPPASHNVGEDECICASCEGIVLMDDCATDPLRDELVCNDCWDEYALEVYMNRRGNAVTTTVPPDDLLGIEGSYYVNREAAEYHGWVYSNINEDYIREEAAYWCEFVESYVSIDNDYVLLGNMDVYPIHHIVENLFFDVAHLELVDEESEDTIPVEYIKYLENYDDIKGELPARLLPYLPTPVTTKPEAEISAMLTFRQPQHQPQYQPPITPSNYFVSTGLAAYTGEL